MSTGKGIVLLLVVCLLPWLHELDNSTKLLLAGMIALIVYVLKGDFSWLTWEVQP